MSRHFLPSLGVCLGLSVLHSSALGQLQDSATPVDSLNDLRLQIKLNSSRAKSLDLAAGTEHLQIM